MLVLCTSFVNAQSRELDSLKYALKTMRKDTSMVNTLNVLSKALLLRGGYDSASYFAHEAYDLAVKLNFASGKGKALNNIGNIYYYTGEYDGALKQFQSGLDVLRAAGNLQGTSLCLNNIGEIYRVKGDFPRALNYYLQALKIRQGLNDKKGMALTLNNVGLIYYHQGNYPEALKNHFEALKIRKEINDKTGQAWSYNNIGAVYWVQGNNPAALENYTASLKLRKELGDKNGIAMSYNNTGLVYHKMRYYSEALQNYINALNTQQEIGDKAGTIMSLNNIGLTYYDQGNFPEAVKYYTEAVPMAEKLDDKHILASLYNNLGNVYVKQNKIIQGKLLLNKGLTLGKQTRYMEDIQGSYIGLARADSLLGNFKESLYNYRQSVLYRDSLINEENTKKTVRLEMNYEFNRRETAAKLKEAQKDILQRAELKRQRQVNWLVGGTGLLALLVTALLFNRYRLRQKNEYQQEINLQQKKQADAVMETQEQERKRIAEDLHDSLGHLLSAVKLNLHALPEKQKQVESSLLLLDQAAQEIRNITFNLMPRTLEEGGLVPALNELATKVNNSETVKVHLHVHDMEKFVLEKQSQFNIYRIVQEAVNNILKHADATEINIQLIGQSDHITIMIEDDGKGFDTQQNNNGRGLKNIVTRSLWLKGIINIDSMPGRGTTITTEIPV